MRVLGLGGLDHNGAVALLEEGRIDRFIECERVLRQKNIGLATPEALHKTLDALAIKDVDAIAVADLTHWSSHRAWLEAALKARFGDVPVRCWHHHNCHAFAALVASPFQRALCVTIDGKGDGLSASVVLAGRDGSMQRLLGVPSANSLGRLWWAVSDYCGLPGHHSAGKVMALAAYGEPRELWRDHLQLLPDGGFRLDPGDLHPDTFREVPRIVDWLESCTGRPAGNLDAEVAASVQALTEQVVLHLVGRAVSATGERRVCLAGGVALNGLANQRLLEEGVVDALYIPPCTDDRGLALGAAALTASAAGELLVNGGPMSPFLGLEGCCGAPGTSWTPVEAASVVQEVAHRILAGEVVAVCRGRDEAGPRALGHRSLLASPTAPSMREHLNQQVKRRESFRPFGCAIPQDVAGEWFEIDGPSPYMLRIAQVRPERAHQIPAALHVDGTSRIQTVTPDDGSGLWPILEALVKAGHPPVLLNTSLNRRGEPLACSSQDAAAAAAAMGIYTLLTDAGLFTLESR